MNTAEIISKIRDDIPVSVEEIRAIIRGITDGSVVDAQIGAFAMAVLWRGLSDENIIALTKAMRDSGDVLHWNIDGLVVDKHSTGGVGDSVSLALAPLLAVAGLYVPMISGRGLGHTGGTLDKLESMSGFQTNLEISQMQSQLASIGCVMAGQSAKITPADKRLYAIRDITGTVPSIDLITASILSKKLAAGLDHLVLDVKCGLGAFMKTRTRAEELAQKLVQTANEAGTPTTALITSMDIPLSPSAGNALEVEDILCLLEGKMMTSRLYKITKALAENLMKAANIKNPSPIIDELILSGKALERFEEMVAAQGGPKGINAIRADQKEAMFIEDYLASEDMDFHGFDAYEIGMSVVGLGGGRRVASDQIDPSVGISHIAEPALMKKGNLLARVHANDEASLNRAFERLDLAVLKNKIPHQLMIGEVS